MEGGRRRLQSSNLGGSLGPPEALGGGGGLQDGCRDRGRSFLLGLQDVVEGHEAQGTQLVGQAEQVQLGCGSGQIAGAGAGAGAGADT